MRTFIVGEDTKLQSVSDKLLLANLSNVRREAALKALQRLNPHADLNGLTPGTVLFVPDTPGFKVTASDSATDAPLAALQQLLESAVRIALDDTVAGNRERLAEQDGIAKAFGDDAVKKLMTERGVGGKISDAVNAVKKGFDADRELAGRAERTVTDVGKAAITKLAELKKTFG
jgi:hypothetical protein